MADTGESSNSMNEKPVIVRVKRKAFQSPLEALWLEINERPLKRPLLDFGNLSISGSIRKEELKAKKIFVQHVETVSSSEAAIDVLKSFMPDSADESKSKMKIEERRQTFKQGNMKNQLLSRAREKHEVLARNARFEQLWRSRKGNEETMHDYPLREICHLYDVVRVDNEEKSNEVEEQDTSLEDNTILCNYLPILREFIPSAAAEIESDIRAYLSKQASTDQYVYDLYTVMDDLETAGDDALNPYPLVQVDDNDDDFYDGPDQSEFESDDSNAEDNPLNEYPDEETSEDEGELESSSSHDEPEEVKSGSATKKLVESEDKTYHDLSEDDDSLSDNERFVVVDDDNGNDEQWINAH